MGPGTPPGSRCRAAAPAAPATATPAAGRGTSRLELHDRVLWVGDPAVVHPEQLADERLADQFEVAQCQVALVELAIGDPLLDDPRDHRPDGWFVARRERPDRGLHTVGEHQ